MTDAYRPRRPSREVHAHLVQRHPLCLPVRQSPGQRQREVRTPHMLLRRGRRLLLEDRHPLPPRVGRLRIVVREKRSLDARRILHVQVVKLHEDAARRPQLFPVRMRICALRPHVPHDLAERAVHQTRLHPQVLRQQHARPLAQQHLVLDAFEILSVEQLRPRVGPRRTLAPRPPPRLLLLRLAVERLQHRDGLLRLRGEPLQPHAIHGLRTHLPRNPVLAPVHQQRRVLELPQRGPTLGRLLQRGPVPPLQPCMVRLRPCALRHASGHVQEARGVPLVLRLHRRRSPLHLLRIPVHAPQHHHVLEGIPHVPAHSVEFPRVPIKRRRLRGVPGLVLAPPRVHSLPENRVVANRRRLLQISRQHSVLPREIDRALLTLGRPRHGPSQHVPHLELDLPQHATPDHAELVDDEELGLPHARPHVQKARPRPRTVRDPATIMHRNAEGAVQRRRPILQLERRAPRRRSQHARVLHPLPPRLLCARPVDLKPTLRLHPHAMPPPPHEAAHRPRLPRPRSAQ